MDGKLLECFALVSKGFFCFLLVLLPVSCPIVIKLVMVVCC